jgi:peptidoglycan/LPS O-acetylase OafA/YrhL
MDLRRLRAGEWIAALSGVVLLVSLFLPWYGGDPGAEDASAWEALAAVDVTLALVAAFAVSLLVVTASQRVPAVPIALSALVTLVGLIGLVLVLVRLASVPDGLDGREYGVWLGLLGTIGIVAGGGVAMHDERLSSPGRHTDLTGRPASAPPEIERLPAPRAE